jgi:hypothetical protein
VRLASGVDTTAAAVADALAVEAVVLDPVVLDAHAESARAAATKTAPVAATFLNFTVFPSIGVVISTAEKESGASAGRPVQALHEGKPQS